MKLRNKKTGEIKNLILVTVNGYAGDDTLAEINEEWEDYEEPKDYYFIRDDGAGIGYSPIGNCPCAKCREEIGNYFETKEEAEQAVEKLKAWKRLKDKGFKFKDFSRLNARAATAYASFDEDWSEIYDDLDLLFGGGE